MDKKIKSVLLKKRQSEAYIARLEQFMLNYDESNADELSTCLEQLESHHQNFLNAIGKLEELDDKDDTVTACINDRCDMDELYRKLRGFFLKHKPMENHTVNNSLLLSSTAALNSSSSVNIRLPKIELPTFDGDDTKWLTFRDRFVAMIDSSAEIPTIMKLQYLLASLKGDAALPFEHTSLTADNYAVTWTMLLKRYDNKRMLCREYYRRLHFLTSVEGNNVDELTSLVDEFNRHVNGLRKLEQPVDNWDVPLTNILFLKLDSESLLAWERHSSTSLQDKYSDFISFLQERIRILRSTLNLAKNKELGSITVAGKNHKSSAAVKGPASSPSYHRLASHAATALREKPMHQTSCVLGCSDRHPLRMCPVFDRKLVKDRRDIYLKRRLCFNCLSAEHQAHACNSKYSCRCCNERHHTLLHVASSVSAPSSPTSSNSPAKITMSAQSADSLEQDTVLLETAIINIVDDHCQQIKARALLDSGSTSNFITESLAKRLQTPQKKVNIVISGIGQAVQEVKNSIVATIESKRQEFSTKMEFFILRAPTSDIPSAPIDVSSWQVPDVTLADPNYHTPGQIDVVIGEEAFWELHTGRKRALGPGKPWLMETPFGWVVAGNATYTNPHAKTFGSSSAAITTDAVESMLQRFWEQETVAEGPALSVQENYC